MVIPGRTISVPHLKVPARRSPFQKAMSTRINRLDMDIVLTMMSLSLLAANNKKPGKPLPNLEPQNPAAHRSYHSLLESKSENRRYNITVQVGFQFYRTPCGGTPELSVGCQEVFALYPEKEFFSNIIIYAKT